MWILLLEVCVALGLLVFLVWWTMFHGRPRRKNKHRYRDRDKQ